MKLLGQIERTGLPVAAPFVPFATSSTNQWQGIGLSPQLGALNVPTVRFEAKKLTKACCLFNVGELMTAEAAVQDFGFAVPSGLESASDYTDLRLEFFAERYGGVGVGANGGAGRTGNRGRWQIKGIGRTPLTAKPVNDDDVWHTHGGISLIDAIQEVVWSEVLHLALPYGAVRVAALLSTGTSCIYEGAQGEGATAPRALVIREAAARPAHFMRAPYYLADAGAEFPSDVERVKEAVRNLPGMMPISASHNQLSNADRLDVGLLEIANRFASQCASAQAKRLMHGAINASNIALDGRWLDFGTCTALPTHANTKSCGAPRHFATLWEEHGRIERVLEELCFFANKYSSALSGGRGLSAPILIGHYRATYSSALRDAALDLVGVPRTLLTGQAESAARILGDALVGVMKYGNERRIESAIPDLSMHGRNNVGPAITELAQSYLRGHITEPSTALLPMRSLRERVTAAFAEFQRALCSETGAAPLMPTAFGHLCLLGGLKASKSVPALYRAQMAADNREIASSAGDLGAVETSIRLKIHHIVDVATMVYSKIKAEHIPVWASSEQSVHYFVQQRKLAVRTVGQSTRTSDSLSDIIDMRELVAFYGEESHLLR